jgi:hypothetical protein
MSDDLPFETRSDAEILVAMRMERRGLRMAINAIDDAVNKIDHDREKKGESLLLQAGQAASEADGNDNPSPRLHATPQIKPSVKPAE